MSKKIILVSALMLNTLLVLAQTEKGGFRILAQNFQSNSSFLAGYNRQAPFGIGFGTIRQEAQGADEEVNYTVLGINIGGQYFVANNLAVGLQFSFSNTWLSSLDNSVAVVMAGPEVTWFFPLKEKIRLYVEGSAELGTATDFEGVQNNTTISRFALGGGLSFFPSRHFSVDAGIGYNSFREKMSDNLKIISNRFGLSIGGSWYFGGKK